MLSTATAVEFSRTTKFGRTGPLVVLAERPDGTEVELVLKHSRGCDLGVTSLAREAIAAELAADLALPVPEAFAVTLDPEFVSSVPDPNVQSLLAASSPVAFGSKLMTGQFSAWSPVNSIPTALLSTAAAIFAFDGIIQNPDRRDTNPNCLVRDTEVRIFDHELAFSHGMVLGWKAPWVLDGLSYLASPGAHVFFRGLRKREIDFETIRHAWAGLGDDKIGEYGSALPPEWSAAAGNAATAVKLISDARDRIADCIVEMRRVLECPAS